MKFLKNAIYLGCIPAMLLSSCATIMNGPNQSIGISSNPANAGIWVDGQYFGQTPMIVKLSRKDNHFLKIQLDGYMPYEATFTRQMSGWVFGNIFIGGIIGVAVDAITGGIYKLTPEQVEAQMAQQMCVNKKGESFIAVVLEVDPSWEKIGQLETSF